MAFMRIHFLGGATTVTGSQFLLETDRARVLIDCGMFQGSPNEGSATGSPSGFEPAALDAVVLTHAHLDHCGLLPLLVKSGYRGPIHATAGTVELATWSCSTPGTSTRSSRSARRLGEAPPGPGGSRGSGRMRTRTGRRPRDRRVGGGGRGRDRERLGAASVAGRPWSHGRGLEDRRARRDERGGQRGRAGRRDPRKTCAATTGPRDRPRRAAVHGQGRRTSARAFPAIDYGEEREVAPGVRATFLDAGHILGSAIIRLRSRITRAGRSGSSSARATSAVPARRSCATRPS